MSHHDLLPLTMVVCLLTEWMFIGEWRISLVCRDVDQSFSSSLLPLIFPGFISLSVEAEQKNILSPKTQRQLKVSPPAPLKHSHPAPSRLPEAIPLLTQVLTHTDRCTCGPPFVVTPQNRCWPDACLTHTEETHVHTHTHSDEGNMADTWQRELIFVFQERKRGIWFQSLSFFFCGPPLKVTSPLHTLDSSSPMLSHSLTSFPHPPNHSTLPYIFLCAPPPFIHWRHAHTQIFTPFSGGICAMLPTLRLNILSCI